MNQELKQLQEIINKKSEITKAIKNEMAKVIIGQKALIDRLIMALLTDGHILLEGVPGLAKTTAISTLAKILGLKFQRMQFTPDLLPSDLIGSRVFNPKDSTFFVKKGPIFANFILADEINRSPAKVQSALLEAMQERQTTIGDQTFKMELPFFVMATQNPIEQEGTYPLPEAQVDRFLLKTVISYPDKDEELEIINQAEKIEKVDIKNVAEKDDILELQSIVKKIYIDESIKKYITDIVFASRNPENIKTGDFDMDNLISYGASPRASIGLMKTAKAAAFLHKRAYVKPEDVKEVAMDVLRHRVIPTYEAEAEGINSEKIVNILLDSVKVP